MLSVENLQVFYGNIKALQGISFKIDEGEIVTIIGANGAGKSTTLKAISRMVPVAKTSRMTFKDKNLLKYSADKVVSELGISHVPEGRRLFGNLTVLENLQLATFARKDRENVEKDIKRVFAIFPRLEERRLQKAGTLSGGEQQMLAMGRALMANPRVLLLDEPSMGLAPVLVDSIFATIGQLHVGGTTILLVEQNARMALQVAGRGYVLQTGVVVLSDSAENLRRNEMVRKAYMGES
jgi:branched-chain amino acid transport system ATP-binding protein